MARKKVKKITPQLDSIVFTTEKRMTALARESTQRLIDRTQVSVAKGGRMRVDTGFLRNSGQLSLTGAPSGPSRPEPGKTYPDWQVSSLVLVLAAFKVGQTIFWGWTANYARHREAKDAFLEQELLRWPQIVRQVMNEIKQRIKK